MIATAELTCTCGHGQAAHEPAYLDDAMCLGFHRADHPFADPELVYTPNELGCRCETFTLASPPEPEPFSVPDGWLLLGLGVCRSCGTAIAWCQTPKGKRAPIDRDGTSHFATCPSADAWRHRRRP